MSPYQQPLFYHSLSRTAPSNAALQSGVNIDVAKQQLQQTGVAVALWEQQAVNFGDRTRAEAKACTEYCTCPRVGIQALSTGLAPTKKRTSGAPEFFA